MSKSGLSPRILKVIAGASLAFSEGPLASGRVIMPDLSRPQHEEPQLLALSGNSVLEIHGNENAV